MADLPIPGLKLSEEAERLRKEVEKGEIALRILKLTHRKAEIAVESLKIDQDIVMLNDRLKEIQAEKKAN